MGRVTLSAVSVPFGAVVTFALRDAVPKGAQGLTVNSSLRTSRFVTASQIRHPSAEPVAGSYSMNGTLAEGCTSTPELLKPQAGELLVKVTMFDPVIRSFMFPVRIGAMYQLGRSPAARDRRSELWR